MIDRDYLWSLVRRLGWVDIPMTAEELRFFLDVAAPYDPEIRWSGYTPVTAFDPTRSLGERNYVLRVNMYNTPMATEYLRLTYAIDDDGLDRNEHFIALDDILVRHDREEIDADTLKNFENFL